MIDLVESFRTVPGRNSETAWVARNRKSKCAQNHGKLYVHTTWRLLFCTRHTEEPSTNRVFDPFLKFSGFKLVAKRRARQFRPIKWCAPSPRYPNHDILFLTKPNCVTCLFWTKRKVTQLGLVKKIYDGLGLFGSARTTLWVEIVLRIFWRPT